MNCKEFRGNLSAFSSEQLDNASRVECETHITTCAECLDLWLSNCPSEFRLANNPDKELVNSILQATNSNTCSEAGDLLVDYIDKALDLSTSEILSGHLANCSSCNKTAMALRQLKYDLPHIALREPPADLLEAVLRQTLPWPTRLIRKISTANFNFSNLIYRPRFSLEASFLGTILWLAVFGLPNNISIWAETEQYRFDPDSIPTIQVEESISFIGQNLEIDVSQLQPLIVNQIDALGNFSARYLDSGITRTRQSSNEFWQTLTRVLPLNRTDNPTNE
jgi:hypothetical protein